MAKANFAVGPRVRSSFASAETSQQSTDAQSFARSIFALRIFLSEIVKGIGKEFLPWPTVVMSDWGSTCSLFRQSVAALSKSYDREFASTQKFDLGRDQVMSILQEIWDQSETAIFAFREAPAEVAARIDRAAIVGAFLKEELETRFDPLTAAAATSLGLKPEVVKPLDSTILPHIYSETLSTHDDRADVEQSPEWNRLQGYLSELDFAIHYNDSLKICMLTRQIFMRWLANCVNHELRKTAGAITGQVTEAIRLALWRLARAADPAELNPSSFLAISAEGRAVLGRYVFFNEIAVKSESPKFV